MSILTGMGVRVREILGLSSSRLSASAETGYAQIQVLIPDCPIRSVYLGHCDSSRPFWSKPLDLDVALLFALKF